jgi:hypothetical protein
MYKVTLLINFNSFENPYKEETKPYHVFLDIMGLVGQKGKTITEKELLDFHGMEKDYYKGRYGFERLERDGLIKVENVLETIFKKLG